MEKIKDNIDIIKLVHEYGFDINDSSDYGERLIYNHMLIAENRIMLIDENTNFMDLQQLYRKLKSDGVLEEVNE